MSNTTQVNSSLPNQPAESGPSNVNPGNQYKNYDFHNMYLEQSGKSGIKRGKILRFSMSCNGVTFNAHLDPNHLTDTQGKRLIQLDVLTGIVLQDFGYTPEIIEFQGTTGAQYYVELLKMQNVFTKQSTNGIIPTPATLTIERRTYTGVWKDFTWNRQVLDGNVYKYDIVFVVMSAGAIQPADTVKSSVIAANTVAVAAANANGMNQVQYVSYAGNTAYNYVSTNPAINNTQRSAALAYLRQNWSTATQNVRSYPGDNANLSITEVLVVPASWSSVLSSSTTNNSAGGTLFSGNIALTA